MGTQNQLDDTDPTPQKDLDNNEITLKEKEKDPTPSQKLSKTKEKWIKIWNTHTQHPTKTRSQAKRPEGLPNKNKLQGYKIPKKSFSQKQREMGQSPNFAFPVNTFLQIFIN